MKLYLFLSPGKTYILSKNNCYILALGHFSEKVEYSLEDRKQLCRWLENKSKWASFKMLDLSQHQTGNALCQKHELLPMPLQVLKVWKQTSANVRY